MAGDDFLLFYVEAEVFSSTMEYVSMGGTMEAIATDVVFLIIFAGYGIHVGMLGHGLMERGVEYSYLGHEGEFFGNGFDA